MSILHGLFTTILNMSITASYVAVGVILVRLLLRKAPKIFSYALWAVVLFRLIFPFSFTTAFSFLGLLNVDSQNNAGVLEYVPNDIGFMQESAVQSGIGSIESAVNSSLPQAAPHASMNPVQVWMDVFSLIWLAGIVVLLSYSMISYIKIKRQLLTATLVKDNIYESDQIGTAFVCGFIHPKIYVPVGVRDTDLSYILEHERTHIRRKDYLIKPLAFLALILHWFNPLMWLSFALMSRDMEMSCDERVLQKLSQDAKRDYSCSLLSLSVKRNGLFAANPLAFGESHVKARIKNVLNYKKPVLWVIVTTVVAVCVVVAAFAANPKVTATFSSEEYNIVLEHPNNWELKAGNIARYEGKDGFFQISAINGESLSIDEVTELDAFHMLEPYGSDPHIKILEVHGQEARLILPSVDQHKEMQNQAGLIVKYPTEVKIGNATYYYFVLWADKAHIEQIVKTISFLNNRDLALNNTAKLADIALTGTDEVEKLVEDNLNIIMSSPKTSSNPQDYINAHQNEYESFFKYGGEDALKYMLTQFEAGNGEGLRGQIMMRLCKELLGKRNNVTDESLSPQEWYNALSIRKEIVLPHFEYDGQDPIEKLVYDTEVEKNSDSKRGGFTVVASKTFGSYEEENLLKVFVTTYSSRYKLFGNVLSQEGGSIIPAAITYRKDDNGRYILEKYEQARDGSEFGPSIREYCTMPVSGKEIKGLSDKIFEHYTDYEDIQILLFDNLFKHLKENGIKDATLTNSQGEVEFSMSNPKYKP